MRLDESDDALRGIPRDILQDIKRAAYEAKVREMEDERLRRERADGTSSKQARA